MGEKLKENWYIIVFSAFVGTIISLSLTSAAVKWGSIDDAVPMAIYNKDKKAFEKQHEEVLNDANNYTDRMFQSHEVKEQIIFNNIDKSIQAVKDQNKLILNNQNELIKMSMDRIKRLEDKVY